MVRSVCRQPNPLPMSACLCLIAPCMSGSRRCTPILGTPLSAWRRTRAGMTEDLRKVYKNVISIATIKYSDQEKIMPIDLPRCHRASQKRHCSLPRPTDSRKHLLSSPGKLERARPEVAGVALARVCRGSIAEPRDPRCRYQARKMEEQSGAEFADRSRRETHEGQVENGAVAEQVVRNVDDAASTAPPSRRNLGVCGRNGRRRGTRSGLANRLPKPPWPRAATP